MTAAKAPKPQRKLGTSGTRIWTDITREYDLDVAALIVLETAAHQADDIARLEALLESEGEIQVGSNGQPKLSSVFGELRQSRLALDKMLDQLRLPDTSTGVALSPASKRAQKAGQARWQRQREREAQARGVS